MTVGINIIDATPIYRENLVMPFPLLIPAFFFAAWLAMVFWGMVAPDVGVPTIGYPKAMLATIGLWLVVFPLARRGENKGGGKFSFKDAAGKEWRRERSKQRGQGWKPNWQTHDEDSVNISSAFSSAARRITSQKFRGGNVSANFGGVQLDLSGAQLAAEGAVLDVRAFLGGIELLVPKGWDVELEVSAFIGGVSDDRSVPGNRVEGGPRLLVRGSAFMGGVSLEDR